jgi:cholinesterase
MWFNVSSTVGCGGAESNQSSVLACMRNANATDILAAVGSLDFTPTVDSVTVFDNYTARALAGQFIKKPLLLGNSDNEAGLFRIGAILAGENPPQSYWDAYNYDKFVCPCELELTSLSTMTFQRGVTVGLVFSLTQI